MDLKPRRIKLASKIATCFLGLGILAFTFLRPFDHAEANMALAVAIFAAMFSVWIGLILDTQRKAQWRFAIGLSPIVLALLVFSQLRFVGFSGEMVPIFRWRSSLKNAGKAQPEASSKTVDQQAIEVSSLSRPETPDHTTSSGSFLQFLGNDRDGIVRGWSLTEDWTTQPPKVRWKRPIGSGWSGFAIANGLAVTLEEFEDTDCVVALSLQTGQLQWRTKLGGKHYHPLGRGGPRATPTIRLVGQDGDNGGQLGNPSLESRVYVQSSTGIVACLALNSGEIRWKVDLIEKAGLSQAESERMISWGRSGSPLIVDDLVVVPFGGKSENSHKSLIALEIADGSERWRGGRDQIGYASPSVMNLFGKRQIVSVNEASVSGHEIADGETLWEFEWLGHSNANANCSQALAIDDHRVFLSKGYHGGCKLLDFSKSTATAKIVYVAWQNPNLMKTKFTNAVLREGHIFGLSDGILECLRIEDGKQMWKDSRRGRFGHGQLILVGRHLLISSEDGRCVLARAEPEESTILGEVPLFSDTTWNPIAIAGNQVLLRNSEEAACLEIPALKDP